MRQTGKEGILSAAFPARIEVIAALREVALGGERDAERLRNAAKGMQDTGTSYGDAPNGAIYSAIGELAACVSFLVEWRIGVLNAAADAQRFHVAARERIAIWSKHRASDGIIGQLLAVAQMIGSSTSVSEVGKIAAALAAVPIPVGLYSEHNRASARLAGSDEKAKPVPVELTVAFLKFTIDGKPLAETHFVSPGETHDLDIEVRVSRWPAGATGLVLEPATAEHTDAYRMPVFSIAAPLGPPPYQLRQQGRASIVVPQHFSARPYEFKYLARFEPMGSEQPVDTVGQRTLLLEGIDLARQPLTGYSHVDQKLVELRNELRTSSRIVQRELTDALALTAPLASMAAQSVQDNLFKTAIAEDEFQERIRLFLRSHPYIGSALEEHPHAARGITDLSLHGIRLELKSEKLDRLVLADCERFVPQAASYAIGSGKRLAVLCVLDGSPKTQPAFPVEDGIGVFVHQTSETPIYVLTVLIQGNLARPSDFSRR
jgi:hypothetical protein